MTPNAQQVARFRHQIEAFVPPGAFDVHAHLYRSVDSIPSLPKQLGDTQGNVTWKTWSDALSQWMGSRAPSAGLFFAFPRPNVDFQQANEFVLQQTRPHAECRALLLIHPGDDPADTEPIVANAGYVGFKIYHVYANRDDTMNAEAGEFLPEWAWEIANRRQLTIMLHIVRNRALADEANQRYIRAHCSRYSHAKLILAHAARGFCAAHTSEGIESLRGLDNVFFDTSAVCESGALNAVLRVFGPSRLLYGSDFPVSEMRGRCVSIGDGFAWLNESDLSADAGLHAEPTLVGIESLLAVRQACAETRLADSDIERIFRDNARELLDLDHSREMTKSQHLYERAKQLIPGGTQLLSKRPEMYAPGRWPAYFREARGCRVVDLDGREYIDMTTSGIGSCLLGFADSQVNAVYLCG